MSNGNFTFEDIAIEIIREMDSLEGATLYGGDIIDLVLIIGKI